MEDFLSQVNDDFVQSKIYLNFKERIQKMKQYILEERNEILYKLNGYHTQLQNIIKNNLSKKPSIQSSQNPSLSKNQTISKGSDSKDFILQEKDDFLSVQKNPKQPDLNSKQHCFLMFHKACDNIFKIYFPLLMDDEFLSLQSESQIQDKLVNLMSIVQKSAVNLIKRLTKNKDTIFDDKKQETHKNISEFNQNLEQLSIDVQEKTKKISKSSKNKKNKGKNSKIPNQSAYILQKWLLQNFNDPYPSQLKKQQMAEASGITLYQVNNWFINARQRVIKKFLKKDNNSNMMKNLRKGSEQSEQKRTKRKALKSYQSQKQIKISKLEEDQYVMKSD